MRSLRLALRPEQHRLKTVWVVADEVSGELAAELAVIFTKTRK
jgi:hypothetical protein